MSPTAEREVVNTSASSLSELISLGVRSRIKQYLITGTRMKKIISQNKLFQLIIGIMIPYNIIH